MKKLLMVAGVVSFLALGFSVQGVHDNLTNFNSSDPEKCEIYTYKNEKVKLCCTERAGMKKKCRLVPVWGG